MCDVQYMCCVAGGRGKDGAPIITFPEYSGFSEVPEEDFLNVVTYLTSIPRYIHFSSIKQKELQGESCGSVSFMSFVFVQSGCCKYRLHHHHRQEEGQMELSEGLSVQDCCKSLFSQTIFTHPLCLHDSGVKGRVQPKMKTSHQIYEIYLDHQSPPTWVPANH